MANFVNVKMMLQVSTLYPESSAVHRVRSMQTSALRTLEPPRSRFGASRLLVGNQPSSHCVDAMRLEENSYCVDTMWLEENSHSVDAMRLEENSHCVDAKG